MARLRALVQGPVVASYVHTYQEFTDDTGQTRPAGSYSVVWIAQAADAPPLEIRKVPAPLPSQGDVFVCWAVQRGQNVVFDAPAQPVAASNGKG